MPETEKKNERIFTIHWEVLDDPKPEGSCLYQMIGFHPMYGAHSLLYIGNSSNIPDRMKQHSGWVEEEPDVVITKTGFVRSFSSWDDYYKSKKTISEAKITEVELHKLERLLIFGCTPAYNGVGVADPGNLRNFIGGEELRIFNVGKHAPLPSEVSSRRWLMEARQ
jgi:hypothetical protein